MGLLTKDRDIHILPLSFENAKDEKAIYLLSDIHFDSVKCDRRLFFKHLDMAKEEGASVFILGDLYDLMNMRFDPRGSYDSLRTELKKMAYIDEVIKDCTSKLEPYKDVIKLIGQGNHETNITKRHGVDVIQRTVGVLNDKGGEIVAGYYAGWVVLKCDRQGKGGRRSFPLHYHHGYGGNAKRSKGVLNVDIDMKDYPQARIIARGHTHQKWYHPVMRDVLTAQFQHSQETVHVVQTGSYKKKDRSIGWEVEKGFSTPRLGGWRFTIKPQGNDYDIRCHELH
jgi:UDP-2,3-diacylglucosamine pyrophosphatase LpxH